MENLLVAPAISKLLQFTVSQLIFNLYGIHVVFVTSPCSLQCMPFHILSHVLFLPHDFFPPHLYLEVWRGFCTFLCIRKHHQMEKLLIQSNLGKFFLLDAFSQLESLQEIYQSLPLSFNQRDSCWMDNTCTAESAPVFCTEMSREIMNCFDDSTAICKLHC